MAAITVRVQRNRFGDIAKQLPISANQIVNGIRGPQMRDIAASLSRVDTGEMQLGWVWRETGNAAGVLENDVEHTIFNEYGTIHMPAQPMARPAAEQVFPLIIDDFQRLGSLLT